MVGDADDVAGIGLLGQLAVRGEEQDGAVHAQLFTGVLDLQLHAALEGARGHAEHGDAVAVVGVHIGLDLEDEAGDLCIAGLDGDVDGGRRVAGFGRGFLAGRQGLGGRSPVGDGAQQLVDAEMAQGRSPQHRRHMALKEGLAVEGLVAGLDQLERVSQVGLFASLEMPGGLGQRQGGGMLRVVVGPGVLPGIGLEGPVTDPGHAAQAIAALGRPPDGGGVELKPAGDLVQQGHGVLGLAVQLVDEGDDRNVAQTTDLEQLERLRLDAFRCVQHHDGAVGGRQGPVGVLGEVLVAGGVEQVEHPAFELEGHDRGGNRDAALFFDLHPVRTGTPGLAARTHRAGRADGPAGEQDVLGQGRLARVRVGDDGEGAPARSFLGDGELGHWARGLARTAPIVTVPAEIGWRACAANGLGGLRSKAAPGLSSYARTGC